MKVVVETKHVPEELLELEYEIKPGVELEAPGGFIVRVSKIERELGVVDTTTVLELSFSFGAGVASSLLASWIYERFAGKANSIEVDETRIEISRQEIESVIAASRKDTLRIYRSQRRSVNSGR